MCQALGAHQEAKQERSLALVELLFQWAETADKHAASGFESRPEACVVQMVTVSAFGNIFGPNQRIFNKNNFAIIFSSGLIVCR